MKFFLLIVSIAGLYFILGSFHGLNTVAFHALGATFSWFAVLFLVGSIALAKVCLSH